MRASYFSTPLKTVYRGIFTLCCKTRFAFAAKCELRLRQTLIDLCGKRNSQDASSCFEYSKRLTHVQ